MAQGSDNKGPVITDKIASTITRVEELSYELKIVQVMTRNIKIIHPDMIMEEIADIFRENRISGAPVVVNDELVGILSLEDLIRSLRAGDLSSPVSKYMTTNIISVHTYDPVVDALKVFVNRRIGRMPVLSEDGKLAGIITKGDITRGLLNALQQDAQVEELRRYRASHLFEDIISSRTSLILRYTIKPRDFTHGGTASSYIKRALLRLGASPQIARRCGIAVYEAEMNLIIHTDNGGTIRIEIEPHQITMETVDDGPGIEDIDKAMQAGYSTASEEVREQGFGAGMGLVNMQRCVDSLKLESIVGKGTHLKMKIFLREQEGFGDLYPHTEESK
jgi:CBS domain-containing protein/anti-sigma regulatory factor (Ser/Thr protein kinase)